MTAVERSNGPPPAGDGPSVGSCRRCLDLRADLRKDRRDLLAEEDERHDRDDGDQRQDERVLRQALTLVVTAELEVPAQQEIDHIDGPPCFGVPPERPPVMDECARGPIWAPVPGGWYSPAADCSTGTAGRHVARPQRRG